MGEFADDAILAGLDQLDDGYDLGDTDYFTWNSKYSKKNKVCKTCGKPGLTWAIFNKHWWLHEYDEERKIRVPHACKMVNDFKK